MSQTLNLDHPQLATALKFLPTASAIAMSHLDGNNHVDYDLKSDNSPVSKADAEIEQVFRKHIQHLHPKHAVIGEEGTKKAPKNKPTWIIDPIDGTKYFIRGIEYFGTLLAFENNAEVVIAIAHLPVIDRTFVAVKGQGTWHLQTNTRVTCSPVTDISKAYISTTDWQYITKVGLTRTFDAISTKTFSFRAYGNTLAATFLPEGKIDAIIEPMGKYWDFAAPALLAAEAGGVATQLDGTPIDRTTTTLLAASTPQLHKTLLEELNATS